MQPAYSCPPEMVESCDNEKNIPTPFSNIIAFDKTPGSKASSHFQPGGRISHLAVTELSNYGEHEKNKIIVENDAASCHSDNKYNRR